MEKVKAFINKNYSEWQKYLVVLNEKVKVPREYNSDCTRNYSFESVSTDLNNKSISIEYYSIFDNKPVYKELVMNNVQVHSYDIFKVLEDETGFMFSLHSMMDFTFKVL